MTSVRWLLIAVLICFAPGLAWAGGWRVRERVYPAWDGPSGVVIEESYAPIYNIYPAFLYPYPRFRPIIYNHPPHVALYWLERVRIAAPARLRHRIGRRVILRRRCCCHALGRRR